MKTGVKIAFLVFGFLVAPILTNAREAVYIDNSNVLHSGEITENSANFTNRGVEALEAQIGPDGTKIYYVGADYQLRTLPITGGSPSEPLFAGHNVIDFAVNKDETKVYFVDFYLMNTIQVFDTQFLTITSKPISNGYGFVKKIGIGYGGNSIVFRHWNGWQCAYLNETDDSPNCFDTTLSTDSDVKDGKTNVWSLFVTNLYGTEKYNTNRTAFLNGTTRDFSVFGNNFVLVNSADSGIYFSYTGGLLNNSLLPGANAKKIEVRFDYSLPTPTEEIYGASCTERNYFDSYSEIPGWGTLESSESSGSGTESVGIWDGFLNLFRDDKTKANTYFRGFYGTGSRTDTLVFQYLDAGSKIENPYAGTGISTIEGSDVFFTVRSKSGSISRIDGITVETVGIYASGSYGTAHFYDTSDREIFRAKMLPYSSGLSNFVGAFVPGTLANYPVKAIVTGADGMVFRKITPVYGVAGSAYKSCKNSTTFCGWRREGGMPTNPLACVDESEYFTDPYSEVVSYLCETTGNACKPKTLTGTYLGAEGVLTSLIIGGKGAYYVDASGSLRYDPEKRNIAGYDKNSAIFKCELEGLAWYEKILGYFDCTWNKLLTPASDAINTPTKITNETLQSVGKAGSGANSIRSLFRTTPGSGEGENQSPLVSIVDGKGFYDMPSGLGRFFLTAFIVVIGMIVLGIVAMLIFNNRK